MKYLVITRNKLAHSNLKSTSPIREVEDTRAKRAQVLIGLLKRRPKEHCRNLKPMEEVEMEISLQRVWSFTDRKAATSLSQLSLRKLSSDSKRTNSLNLNRIKTRFKKKKKTMITKLARNWRKMKRWVKIFKK